MRLLSLFGIDRRLRRVRAAVGEGALAAEDRLQLVRMAWDEEKRHLKRVFLLSLAALGLTTVAVALLSVAVVVHYWDTPYRAAAAWSVAAVWLVLWLLAIVGLLGALRQASDAFEPAKRELERDWLWMQQRFGNDEEIEAPEPRPATRAELLLRIEQQRERIARQELARAQAAAQAAMRETPGETASRLVREHPVAAAAAAAGVVAVVGPRRILRWTMRLLPIVLRLR